MCSDRVADPTEPFGGKRCAGRTQLAQRRQVGQIARPQSGLAARHDERCADTEHVDSFVLGDPPQRAEVGRGGIAVEQHDRRTDAQPRHDVVPHHPPGGREPQEPSARTEVVVQAERLDVLEQHAAVPVHDRFRQAGGARREQHVQRMVERNGLERDRLVRCVGEELGPSHDRHRHLDGCIGVEVGEQDDVLHRGQRGHDLGQFCSPIDRLESVLVAVDGDDDHRFELRPPIDDGAHAELGCGRREDRAEAGRRQAQHDRLGDVGQVRGHAVTAPNTQRAQAGATASDSGDQVVVPQFDPVSRLGQTDDRSRSKPQRVFGVVQACRSGTTPIRAVKPAPARRSADRASARRSTGRWPARSRSARRATTRADRA